MPFVGLVISTLLIFLSGASLVLAEGLYQESAKYDFLFAEGQKNLPDLHIAMVNDQKLYVEVANLKEHTFDDFLNIENNLEGKVEEILFRWAGVDTIDPTSRGPNIDARALAIFERFMGDAFIQKGVGAEGEVNPMFWAAVDLQHGYDMLFSAYFSLLMAQSVAHELFSGTMRYQSTGFGRLTGVTGINPQALTKVSIAANTLVDREERYLLWQRVLRVINSTIGIAQLTKEQQASLYYAVQQSGIDWEALYRKLGYKHPKDMRGSHYAEEFLGMKFQTCNVKDLFDQARKRSRAREIIINNLLTKLINKCGSSEEVALDLFKKSGFGIQDVTASYNQREVFGDHPPYERVYIASSITLKNQIYAYFMIPYDLYFTQLFIRNGQVEWATGILNRPKN